MSFITYQNYPQFCRSDYVIGTKASFQIVNAHAFMTALLKLIGPE